MCGFGRLGELRLEKRFGIRPVLHGPSGLPHRLDFEAMEPMARYGDAAVAGSTDELHGSRATLGSLHEGLDEYYRDRDEDISRQYEDDRMEFRATL